MNIVGPQVRELREARALTQQELAARCNVLGWDISRGTLAKIEARVRRVTDLEAALLGRALKVDVSELFPSYKESTQPYRRYEAQGLTLHEKPGKPYRKK